MGFQIENYQDSKDSPCLGALLSGLSYAILGLSLCASFSSSVRYNFIIYL